VVFFSLNGLTQQSINTSGFAREVACVFINLSISSLPGFISLWQFLRACFRVRFLEPEERLKTLSLVLGFSLFVLTRVSLKLGKYVINRRQ
jgi:hypothetical protein